MKFPEIIKFWFKKLIKPSGRFLGGWDFLVGKLKKIPKIYLEYRPYWKVNV